MEQQLGVLRALIIVWVSSAVAGCARHSSGHSPGRGLAVRVVPRASRSDLGKDVRGVPMSLPTYDEYRDRYVDDLDAAVRFSGKGHEFFTRRKADELLELSERYVASTCTLEAIDVGCGIGLTDSFLAGRFASVTGVDVTPGVLERAAARNPDVQYERYDGERLPFGDATFDVTFTAGVVQVLRPERRLGFLDELRRVTRGRGIVVVFEHNPYNPLTRLAVRRFSLGHDAQMLAARQLVDLAERAGLAVLERSYILLLPSESRVARAVERRVERLPIGAQYVVVARPAHAA